MDPEPSTMATPANSVGGITLRDLNYVQESGTIPQDAPYGTEDQSLRFEFERHDGFENYHLEGDQKYDQAELLQIRRRLFHNEAIQRKLRTFWRLAANDGNGNLSQTISRDQYIDIHMKISKALRADWDSQKAVNIATQDWIADIKRYRNEKISKMQPEFEALNSQTFINQLDGDHASSASTLPLIAASPTHHRRLSSQLTTEVMDEKCFMLSIYEIADHWTDTLDPKWYTLFLRKLFRRITSLNEKVVWDYQPMTKKEIMLSKVLVKFPSKSEDQNDNDVDNGRPWTRFAKHHMFELEEALFSAAQRTVFLLRPSTKPGKPSIFLTADLEKYQGIAHEAERSQVDIQANGGVVNMWAAAAKNIVGSRHHQQEKHLHLRRNAHAAHLGIVFKDLDEITPMYDDSGQYEENLLNNDASQKSTQPPAPVHDSNHHSTASRIDSENEKLPTFVSGNNSAADSVLTHDVPQDILTNGQQLNEGNLSSDPGISQSPASTDSDHEWDSSNFNRISIRVGHHRRSESLSEAKSSTEVSNLSGSSLESINESHNGNVQVMVHQPEDQHTAILSTSESNDTSQLFGKANTSATSSTGRVSKIQLRKNDTHCLSSSFDRRKRDTRTAIFGHRTRFDPNGVAIINEHEASVNAMESAAARRSLRNGNKLPSLVSFYFDKSIQLGKRKERERRAKNEAAIAAAALAREGISPTHAELFGPAIDMLQYQNRRSMAAHAAALRHQMEQQHASRTARQPIHGQRRIPRRTDRSKMAHARQHSVRTKNGGSIRDTGSPCVSDLSVGSAFADHNANFSNRQAHQMSKQTRAVYSRGASFKRQTQQKSRSPSPVQKLSPMRRRKHLQRQWRQQQQASSNSVHVTKQQEVVRQRTDQWGR